MYRALLVGMSAAIAYGQGTLSGIVVDESTGKPIGGASLGVGRVSQVMTQARTIADSAGRFQFDLAPGQYWVECASDGYVEVEGYTLDGPRADVLANVVTPIKLRLVPAGSIEGRLLTENGEPIPNATVEVFRSGKKGTTTGEDGAFRLVGLSPGEYKLRARFDDALRRARADTGASLVTALPRITFYPDVPDPLSSVPFQMAKGMQVHGVEFRVKVVPVVTAAGVVIDSKTGAPLEYGEMELRPAVGFSPGDSVLRVALNDGRFRFDLLPPGAYNAYIYRSAAPGAPPFIVPIDVGTAGAADLRLTSPFGGSLNGSVSGPKTSLTAIQLTPVGSFAQASAKIDAEGRFTFRGLAPGKWTLGFLGGPAAHRITVKSVRQGDRVLFPYIVIADGDNPPLEVELTEMLHVTGVVLDRSGKPVEQAVVMFYRDTAPALRRSIPSGTDGNFDMGIVAGDFQVSAFRSMPPRQVTGCDTSLFVHITGDLAGLKLVLCP